MAARKLLECSFLIPIRRDAHLSDGELHKQDLWDWLDGELFDFGGATRSNELYDGWYPDPDTNQRVDDVSKKYFVAISKSRLPELRALLRVCCDEFRQKCIYLSVAGQVEFVMRRKK